MCISIHRHVYTYACILYIHIYTNYIHVIYTCMYMQIIYISVYQEQEVMQLLNLRGLLLDRLLQKEENFAYNQAAAFMAMQQLQDQILLFRGA